MKLQDFAELTLRVIKTDGLDGHLPTLCVPGRRIIRVLEGVDDEDIESASREWAGSIVEGNEDYLLAFRISSIRFKIVGRLDMVVQEEIFEVPAEKKRASSKSKK